MPEAAPVITRNLPVFEAMRALEITIWPVSDGSPGRLAQDLDTARKWLRPAADHLNALLATWHDTPPSRS